MRSFTAALCGIAAFAVAVLAAGNPITLPNGSEALQVGKLTTITWTPTSGDTVTLSLSRGSSDNLEDVIVLASGVENNGRYEWTPGPGIDKGDDYAIAITGVDGVVNYTPLLSIGDGNSENKLTASDSSKYRTAAVTGTKSSKHSTSMAIGVQSGETAATTGKTTTSVITTLKSNAESTAVLTASSKASLTFPQQRTNAPPHVTSAPSSAIFSPLSNFTLTTKALNLTKTTTTKLKTKSKSYSETVAPSESETTPMPTPTVFPPPESAGVALLHSPFALMVCVIGAIMYLS